MDEQKGSDDISRIIYDWQFDPEKDIRVINGDDNISKIQVRAYENGLHGIFQVNLDGGPDGERPYGFDFAYEYYNKVACSDVTPGQYDDGFSLDNCACKELIYEADMLGARTYLLERLEMDDKLIEDTERQINIYDLIMGYSSDETQRLYAKRSVIPVICQNTEFILRRFIGDNKFDQAVDYVKTSLEFLDELQDKAGDTDLYIDKMHAITTLVSIGIIAGRECNDYRPAVDIAKIGMKKLDSMPKIESENFSEMLVKETEVMSRIMSALQDDIEKNCGDFGTGYVFEDMSYQTEKPEIPGTVPEPPLLNDVEQGCFKEVEVSQEEIDLLLGKDIAEKEPEPGPELTEKEKLVRDMQIASAAEDYEMAALLRDRIRKSEGNE